MLQIFVKLHNFFFPLLFCGTKGTFHSWLHRPVLHCVRVKLSVVNAKKLLNHCQLVILYIARFSVKQKVTRSLSHFRFVIGIHHSCLHFSDLFLELKLATHCINSLFFCHVQYCRQSHCTSFAKDQLTTWFYYYVVKMFYIDWVFWFSCHFLFYLP